MVHTWQREWQSKPLVFDYQQILSQLSHSHPTTTVSLRNHFLIAISQCTPFSTHSHLLQFSSTPQTRSTFHSTSHSFSCNYTPTGSSLPFRSVLSASYAFTPLSHSQDYYLHNTPYHNRSQFLSSNNSILVKQPIVRLFGRVTDAVDICVHIHNVQCAFNGSV